LPNWRVATRIPATRIYAFTGGGMRDLPPYAVWENDAAFPRAYVAPCAQPLPPRAEILAALRTTDFRRIVLLEEFDGTTAAADDASLRPANIVEYTPNRVIIDVAGDAPGHLVLSDPWYPGWTATLDGQPVPIRRANYLFRSVSVTAGTHRVEFRFEPASLARGRALSLAALALAGAVLLASGVMAVARTR
jgi:hypothetical protein